MRFEEPVNNRVTRFPELRVYNPRQIVPFVTHEEIAEGIARGRRLHARFCRQAANEVLVRPALATARFAKRIIAATIEKFERDRALRGTVRELCALEDRQLRDIGIDRSDIPYIARTLAYPAQGKAPTATSPVEPSLTENTFEHERAA